MEQTTENLVIRCRAFAEEEFRGVEVAQNGRIDKYPYDVRATIIHPEDRRLLKQLDCPARLHTR